MPTTITNQGSATYQFNGSQDVETVQSNTNSIVLQDNQGLSITKTASPTDFLAGDIINYTITITNNSSQYLTGVRIIDNLGGGNLAYVLGSASLTSTTTYPVNPVSTNPLTFTLQQLNVGQSMTLTYRAQVIFNLPASVQSITNTVQGIGYTSTGTINGFANTTIQKKTDDTDLTLVKTASANSVLPYQVFNYFLTVGNSSNTSATIASITDQLPDNFVLTDVYLRVGNGINIQLQDTDYLLNATNLLVIPSGTGPTITVPANSTSVITISGYFV